MLLHTLASFLLLPAAIRAAALSNSSISSSTACNNSPQLCSRTYDDVVQLGAHDSPFLRDASTGFSTSGNQYYNTTVQLSGGVRLLTAQVQLGGTNGDELHVCHTSCDLLDSGTLVSWLAEVRTWIEAHPHDVVTVLLVNGASSDATTLAGQYSFAGISTSLMYTPSGSSAKTQSWPTLQSLIDSGTRMVNFVADLNDNSATPYLMNEFDFIVENSYENTSPTDFTCDINRPAPLIGQTTQAISNGYMPLMNHFLYHDASGSLFNIEYPNSTYVTTTNAPSGGLGNLGTAAESCKSYYGKAPTFILVDFFNVGPAMATVDSLNGITSPVGRTRVSAANKAPDSGASSLRMGSLAWLMGLPCLLALALL